MQTIDIEELKFPTGKHKRPETFTAQELQDKIKIIQDMPAELHKELAGTDEKSLNYMHRPEGWTIKQIVHHFADSHMNAFIRFKLALTEDNPTIKPYREAEWAKMIDGTMAMEPSVKIIEGVHARWGKLLPNISAAELDRTVFHPEYKRTMKLSDLVFLYAWHCGHHIAHIKNAKKYKNQF